MRKFSECAGEGLPAFITAPNISAVHAFTTRYGGVSEGVYESLNLGQNVGDEPDRVRENYDIICRELGITPDTLVCSRQIHGNRVRTVTREDCGRLFAADNCEADGLITCDAGVALMVFTADCVPILLQDPVKGAVGAVHAGWRGTVSGIAGEAVRRLGAQFGCVPSDIRAAIGPCISKCCFETGPEVPGALREALSAAAEDCIAPAGNKFMVDLKQANRLMLIKAGLLPESVFVSGECTSCSCDKFWSHRRTNGIRGSQAAIITLKGSSPR